MQAFIKTTVDTSDEIAKFSSTTFPTLEAMTSDMDSNIRAYKEETGEAPVSILQDGTTWSVTYHAAYHEYYASVNI